MKSFLATDAPALVRQSRARHPSRSTLNLAAQTIAERAAALARTAAKIACSTDTGLEGQHEDAAMLLALLQGTSEPSIILRSYRKPVPEALADLLVEEMRDRATDDGQDVQGALARGDVRTARRAAYSLLHAVESMAGLQPQRKDQP